MKQGNPIKVLIALIFVLLIVFVTGLVGRGITLYNLTDMIFIKPVNKIEITLYRAASSVKNKRAYFDEKEALLEENKRLKTRNKILEERIKLIKAAYDDNIRLKNIFGIGNSKKLKFTTANVIGEASAPFKFIIIDKGESEGIKKGEPVVITDGTKLNLVGITYSVASNTTKVLMSTDPLFFVSVKDINTGELAISQGNGKNLKIIFKILKPKISVNDVLTTTSVSSIYPEGIIVGKISKINEQNKVTTIATITSNVDFRHLFEVMVLNK